MKRTVQKYYEPNNMQDKSRKSNNNNAKFSQTKNDVNTQKWYKRLQSSDIKTRPKYGGIKPTSGHSYWLRRTGSIQPYNLFKNIGRDDVFSVIPRRLKSTERKKKTRNGG